MYIRPIIFLYGPTTYIRVLHQPKELTKYRNSVKHCNRMITAALYLTKNEILSSLANINTFKYETKQSLTN